VETWRYAGFITVIAAPKGGMFFPARRLCSIWEASGPVIWWLNQPVRNFRFSLQAPGGLPQFTPVR